VSNPKTQNGGWEAEGISAKMQLWLSRGIKKQIKLKELRTD